MSLKPARNGHIVAAKIVVEVNSPQKGQVMSEGRPLPASEMVEKHPFCGSLWQNNAARY